MKTCVSCGMPMAKSGDYPLGDETKDYCVHCARADGTLQSYDERLEGLASFMVRTQGLDAEAARSAARTAMAKLPAWRDRR